MSGVAADGSHRERNVTEKGKQTEAQQETDWPILRTVDDALRALGVMK
jgi:hypothetical protein